MLRAALPIILPVIAVIVAEVIFLRTLRRRSGHIEVFEIGVFFSLIVLLYTVFPVISLFANRFDYSLLGDSRLFGAQPSPVEIAPVYWLYFLFLASFAVGYCVRRGGGRLRDLLRPTPGPRTFWILLGCYLMIRLYFVFLRIHYNLLEAESYGENYLLYKDLPLYFQQLANHLGGMGLTLQLVLMAFLVLNYKKYKFSILVWVTLEFLSLALFGVGARTGLFVLILAFLTTYHLAVRPLTKRFLAFVCVSAVFLFLGLGIVRALEDSSGEEGVNLLSSSNEFDAILANAYDLRELKAEGKTDEIFPQLYFADLLNLIPQQVSPFRKLDLSAWYVESFYPSLEKKGGGLAFGVISESVVGLGWFDAVWRGALIGWIFAWIFRFLLRGPTSFWKYCFYLWATSLCYQVFRGGTFLLVPRFVYQFLFLVLIFNIIRSVTNKIILMPGTLPSGAAAD